MKNIALAALLLLTITGCGTKKKTTNRINTEETKTEQKVIADVQKQEIIIDSLAVSKTDVVTTTANESIQVVAANDSTSVDVLKQTEGNVTRWSIKGAESFKIENEQSKQTKVDTTAVQMVKDESKEVVRTEQSKTEETLSEDQRTSDVDIKRTSSWWWLLLILAILVVAVWIMYKKKVGLFLS